jgi:hypothetical protein
MTVRIQIPAILIAGFLCAGDVSAGVTVNNVEFKPIFNAASGLELHVQNYTKLPKTLAGVEVFIGGTAQVAACRVTVPGITLAPAARNNVIVADVKTVNSCLPARAAATVSHRLTGLQNIPLKTGSPDRTPLQFERSVRIVPHFEGADGKAPPRQLRFRFAD